MTKTPPTDGDATVIPIKKNTTTTPGRRPTTGRKPISTRGRGKPRNIQVTKRRADVIGLRNAGWTYTAIAESIAEKYGMPRYSRADAAGDVRIALDRIIEEPAREWLAIELNRLNSLQAALWVNAMGGDVASALGILRIMDRRSRYLGLDSPIKHDLTGGDRDEVTVNLSDPTEVARAGLEFLAQIATEKDKRSFDTANRQLTSGA